MVKIDRDNALNILNINRLYIIKFLRSKGNIFMSYKNREEVKKDIVYAR